MWKKIGVDRKGGPSLIYLVMALLLLGACATSPVTQPKSGGPDIAVIESIKVNPSPEQTVVEVINKGEAPFTSFTLLDPQRVILDIRGKPGEDLPPKKTINAGNVEEIRVEKGETQAMTTRVTVALSQAMDYQAVAEGQNIKLTLTPKPEKAEARAPEPQAVAEAETKEPPITPSKPRIFFKPEPSSELNQVLGVDFTLLDHGKSQVTVTTDKKVAYDLERKGPKALVLKIAKSAIPPLLTRQIDSSEFSGVVEDIDASTLSDKKEVDIAISLREMVPYHIRQQNQEIILEFGSTEIKPATKKIVPLQLAQVKTKPVAAPPGRPSMMPSVSDAQEEQTIPGLMKKKYTGAPMTMDFVNADVTNILRLIGEVSNLNIVWGPEVKGNVSMRLKNVPWDQAMDLILTNNNLAQRRMGNVIWVTTMAQMNKIEAEEKKKQAEVEAEKRKQEEAERQAREAAVKKAPLITEYLPIDFAKADDVKKHIVLTDRGTLSVDPRTNTIIIKDTAESVTEARRIVKQFDTPVKQIMIEARIVDATRNFTRDLGVQWNQRAATGGTNQNTLERRKNTGVAFGVPTDATTYAAGGDRLIGGYFSSNAPQGWASNLGFTLGYLTSSALGAINIDASLALAETEGTVEIISAPKVLASNGEQAEIKRGTITYRDIATADRIATEQLEASLSLVVTPTVSFNDYVTMDIALNDDQAFLDLTGKTLKTINTKLIVKSGDTIVIGGIYTENNSDNESGIPWLRKVPGLGYLFSATTETRNKTELLIFLTPTVVPTATVGKEL